MQTVIIKSFIYLICDKHLRQTRKNNNIGKQ